MEKTQSRSLVYNFTIALEKGNELPLYNNLSLCILYAELTQLEEHKERFLHFKELEKITYYTFPLRRSSFLLGRAAAKKAITLYIQDKEEKECHILIENGLYGEPKVRDKNINISISHSNNFAACIASSLLIKVGIDIECLAHVRALGLYNNDPHEVALFENQNIIEIDLIYCLIWTTKEALVKYLETGFTIPIDLLKIEKIYDKKNNFLTLSFKNFPTLQAVLFYTDTIVVGICVSKKITIENSIGFSRELNMFVQQLSYYNA